MRDFNVSRMAVAIMKSSRPCCHDCWHTELLTYLVVSGIRQTWNVCYLERSTIGYLSNSQSSCSLTCHGLDMARRLYIV